MTVTLTGTDVSNNSVSLSTTTLPDGTFAFNGVLPGNYNITKVQPIGYMDGRETAGNLGGMVNNGTDSGAIYEIVIGNEGVAATNYLFGNLRASAVSGYVWQELNNDGNIDGNEGSVPGVTINLTGTDDRANTVIQAVNTNLDGSYSFLGLRPGTYSVSQVQPAGFLDGLDMLGTVNGIGAGTNAVNDVFSGLRLNRSGSIAENYNFGERILPVVVSGRVYNDRNNNGSFNSGAGEFGIAGVLVTLTGYDNFDNSVILSTTTLSDGSFAFHGVFPGTYTLTSDQPVGFLDGRETEGNLGGIVNNGTDNNGINGVVIGNDGIAATDYLFGELRAAEISGLVWEDFNVDGQVNFGEAAIDNAQVTLSGTDDRGNPVNMVSFTDNDGVYMFYDLRPGTYGLAESQPAGFSDAAESLGTVNGVPTGVVAGNDRFGGIAVGTEAVGINYNFAERPLNGGGVSSGQTATIGFWQNNNGRALILALNGGANSTPLSNWLAATLPNMYGTGAGTNDLTGKTNTQVWDFYNALFRRKQKEAQALGLGGPTKTDAQVFATALAVYVTNGNLAGTTGTSYGFVVSQNGVGASTFNVGSSGQAFGVANGSVVSVMDLLLAANARSRNGVLYDMDSDGDANDSLEINLRTMLNNVFSTINESGNR